MDIFYFAVIKMTKFIIVYCFLIVFFGNTTNAQKECITPDNKSGICIPLRSCAPLLQIILNFETSSRAEKDFVLQSQCGPNGQDPPVCCAQVTQSEPSKGKIPENWNILPKPGECGFSPDDRIFHGTKTSIAEYPWMALIEYSRKRGDINQNEYKCGGSLISANYVVTAGHCVAGKILKDGWKPIIIRLGEHNLEQSPDCDGVDCAHREQDIGINDIIVHEHYEPFSTTQYNDIALIRLSRSIQFTMFVSPVCLPIAAHLRNQNNENKALTVVGFGRTENGIQSEVKLKLKLPGEFNWNRCDSIYQQKVNISLASTQLCAGGIEYEDSCSGDSGGPLVAIDNTGDIPYTYLVGVVSQGSKVCGTKDFPGLYTRVDQYLSWIVGHMEE